MKYLKKILLVDDEVEYVHLLTVLLRRQGFDVYAVTNGQEVTEIIRTFKPDLVVLDVRLGNMDGKELCRQLKDNPATRNIIVILHSAFPGIDNEYQLCGADDFILKPTDVSHLVRRINEHLGSEG